MGFGPERDSDGAFVFVFRPRREIGEAAGEEFGVVGLPFHHAAQGHGAGGHFGVERGKPLEDIVARGDVAGDAAQDDGDAGGRLRVGQDAAGRDEAVRRQGCQQAPEKWLGPLADEPCQLGRYASIVLLGEQSEK